MLRILIITLVVLVAALFMLRRPGEVGPPPVQVATVLDTPRALPTVEMTDASGRSFTIADLAGRHVILFFGYTNCPDICPITLSVLADALGQLREKAPALVPSVLFVSVDPARDTPQQIHAYLHGFDETFLGATAEEAALAPLLEFFGVSVHREDSENGVYNVTHNGTIFVLDDAGRWEALFGGSSHRAEDIVGDYLALRASDSGG
jgi:protein SCO1